MSIVWFGDEHIFHKYANKMEPQSAYLELDCEEGTLRADWDREIGGGISFSVYNGRTIQWSISSYAGKSYIDYLMRRAKPFCEKILGGYTSEYVDGNWVGTYTEAASKADEDLSFLLEELRAEAEDADLVRVLDSEEWVAASPGISERAKREGVEKVVKEDLQIAEGQGQQVKVIFEPPLEETLENLLREE